MAVLLLAIANNYDPCRVSIPGQIIDPPSYNVILALGGPFTNTVPYPDSARDITAGNIVARRRESSNSGTCSMSRVLSADGGIIN